MSSQGFDESGGVHGQREPLLAWRIPKETDRATLRRVRVRTSLAGEFQNDPFMMMTDCRAWSEQAAMERDVEISDKATAVQEAWNMSRNVQDKRWSTILTRGETEGCLQLSFSPVSGLIAGR